MNDVVCLHTTVNGVISSRQSRSSRSCYETCITMFSFCIELFQMVFVKGNYGVIILILFQNGCNDDRHFHNNIEPDKMSLDISDRN